MMVRYSFKQNKKLKKLVSWATLLLYLGQPAFVAAQVVADPNAAANNKPIIETTANGLPMVQIAAPSAAGVSRNLYQQFDIGTRGLILNNANAVTNTQLAGYVYGNPNLTNGQARIILNEVTGSGISQLNGYLEVAGQKAQVIIANPNGIAVNGFGFINTSRGVLTTGIPLFGGSGSLDAFRVTGGQISVQGAGLDASTTDRAELISRTVSANAGIWAKDLSVVTGSNKVDYETLATEKLAQPDEGAAVALDVGALGGMYANKIKLIGTEKGVGVNSQGTLAASGGDLTLTQAGKIILAGNTSASGNIALHTNDSVLNQGTVYAQGNADITAAGTLTNTGVLAAGRDTAIKAQSIVSTGTLGAGITTDGTLSSAGNLTLSSNGTINAQGQNLVGGDLTETGTAIDHSGAVTYAGGNANITATAGDVVNSGGSIEVKGALTLTAAGTLANDKAASGKAGQISAGNLKLTANSISNKGGTIVQTGTDQTDITVSENLDNNGGSLATNGASFTISANTINNTQGQIQHAGVGGLMLTAAGTLKNDTGSIVSNGQLAVSAQNLDNTRGTITAKQQLTVQGNALTSVQGTISSGDVLNIKAQGSIDNRQGTIEGAKGLELAAQSLTNVNGRMTNLSDSDTKISMQQEIQNQAGLIGGNGNVLVAGKSLANQGGKLTAQGTLTLNAVEGIDNTNGILSSGLDSTLHLMSGNLTNIGGTVSTGGNLSIQALEVDNTNGSLLANQDIHLVADKLSGNASTLAGNDLTLTLSGDLRNSTGGELKANRNVNITVNGDITNQGNITGVQAVTISGNNFSNETDAVILAGQNLHLSATGNVNNQGRMGGSTVELDGENIDNSGTITADELTLKAGNIANSTSSAMLNSTKDITLETTATNGSLTNKGTVYAQGKTKIHTAGTVENAGTVAAGQNTTILAAALHSTGTLAAGIKNDGSLGNTGNLTLIADKTLTAQGENMAGGNLREQGAAIEHRGAVTYAGGNATLTATGGDINNAGGVLQAGGQLTLTAAGTISNDKASNGTAGQIAGEHISMAAKSISNQGGTIVQTGTEETSITASENIDNTGGTVATNGAALTVKAGSLTNTKGKIQQAGTGSLEVVTGGDLANQQGLLTTNGKLTLTSGELNNNGGAISANKAITVSSSGLINDKGTIVAHDNITLTVQNEVSNQQGIMEAGKQFTLSAANLANRGGSLTSLDASGFTITTSGGIDNTSGTLGGNGDVSLTAMALDNFSGKIISGKNLTGVISNTLDNLGGNITAGQDITLGQNVPLGMLNNGAQGSITAGGKLVIAANQVDNQGSLLANQDITIISGSINAGGNALAGRDMTLTVSGDINQQAGGELAANRNMAVKATSLTSQGSMIAVQELNVAANSVTNALGAKLAAGQALTVEGEKLTNQGTVSGSNLRVTAKEIDNSGNVAADALHLKADTLTNHGNQASIRANQASDLAIATAIHNTDGALLYNASKTAFTLTTGTLTNSGSILSGGDVQIMAQDVVATGALGAGVNADGTLGTLGSLTITSTGKLTGKGRNLAAQDITMTGKDIDLSGAKTAAGNNITLTAVNGNIDNTGGVLQAGDTIDLKAAEKLVNDNAGMQAKLVKMKGNTLSNIGGKILQTGTGDTVIKTVVVDNTGGMIATNGNSLTLEADDLTNKQGSIIHAGTGSLTLTTPGKLDNTGGTIRGNGTVAVAASALDNIQGTIAGQQGLQFTGSALTNDQGALVTKGAMNVQVQNLVSNRQGLVEAGKALTVTAQGIDNQGGSMTSLDNSGLLLNASQTIDNTSGTIGANGDVTLTSASLSNRAGKVLSKGNIHADVSQSVDNTSGKITAEQDVTLGRNAAVGSVNNTQGSITAGVNLLTKAIAFDNTNGNLAANQDLNYTVTNLNGTGSLTAGQDLTINLAGDFTYANGETLTANRDLTLKVANLTNNGKLSAVGNLTVSANNVTNGSGATLESGAGLTVNATGDVNNSGTIQGSTVDITGRNIYNTGAMFGSNMTLTADTISNVNNTAVMATTKDMNLFAKTSLVNTDDATIYSQRRMNIAGSNEVDTNGQLVKTSSVLNQSASIEAEGDITISANELTNKMKSYTVEETKISETRYDQEGVMINSANNNLFFLVTDKGWTRSNKQIEETSAIRLTPGKTYQYPATWLLAQSVWQKKVMPASSKSVILAGNNMILNIPTINNELSEILASKRLLTQVGGVLNNISVGNEKVTKRQLVYADSSYMHDKEGVYLDGPHADENIMRQFDLRINRFGGDPFGLIGEGYTDTVTEQLSDGISSVFGGGQAVSINTVNVNNITVASGTIQTGTVNSLTSSGRTGSVDAVQNSSNAYNVGVQTSTGNTGVVAKAVSAGGSQTISASGRNSATGTVSNPNASIQTISIQNAENTKINTSGVPLENMQTLLPTSKDTTAQVKQTSNAAITVPANALYKTHTEPEAKYLVETDSRFTSYGNFVSSDYMLQRLNVDPTKVEKRLGDGFYEQKLVRVQVTELTGRYTLSSYSSAEEQYKALLSNGATYAKEYNLQVGVALTAEQMSQLTSDIVWLVEKEVNGQKVLVPQVYLAQAHVLQDSGALITGDNVAMNVTGNVTNGGSINGKDSVQITAANIANFGGSISSDNLVKLDAKEDLFNFSGTISGTQVGLTAGQNLKNETVSITSSLPFLSHTVAANTAEITAVNSLSLQSGGDVSLAGANLSAGQDVSLLAGRNITVDSIQTKEHLAVGSYLDDSVTNLITKINAGNNLTVSANQDTTIKGAQVKAGNDLNLLAGNNITVTAVKDETIHDHTYGNSDNWTRIRTDDETVIGTNLEAGKNVTVAAGVLPQGEGSVTIAGSTVTSEKGNATITGTKDVTLQNVTEKHEKLVVTHKEDSGFFSSTTKDTRDYSLVNQVKGSTVSGDSVKVAANKDVNVIASNIVGTNDINLTAGNDVNIVSAKETGKDDHYSKTTTSGIFSGGGIGFTIGSKSETTNLKEQTLDEIGSTVGSINGNVNINAGNKANSAGTTFVSGKDLNVKGKEVNIDNTVNTYDSQYKYEFKQSGLTVSLGGGIVTTALDAASSINRSGDVSDSRLKALYDYKAVQDIKKIGDELAKGDIKSGVSIGVSIGSSSSSTEQTVHVESVNLSNINAGGNVNIKAVGSDVNLKGTKIDAKDITIEAVKNINIAGAQNKEQTDSKSSSSSWSVGGNIGVGFNASFGNSSGKENEKSTTNVSSVVNASGTTTLKSGQDTNIIASKVQGEKVVADVGGNLNIASKQDTKDYTSNNQSSGFGVSTGQVDGKKLDSGVAGPINKVTAGGTTGSFSTGKTDSTYASVTGQAGIYAGKQGFDINVGKNTDLKGAVISSEAPAVKNALQTGDLTIANLENRAKYQSSSIGAGYDSNLKVGMKLGDLGFIPNFGIPSSDSANSTTKSAISNGTIEVRNNPNIDLSTINRDTTNSVNALGKIFDKQTVEERQELSKVFGEVAFEEIHKLSENKGWKDGDPQKVALHTLVGALLAQMGGADALSGGFSAGVNEGLQKELSNIKDPALRQWASLIIGSAAAKLAGGTPLTGGSIAASGTKNNNAAVAVVAVYTIPGIGEVALLASGVIVVGGLVYEAGSWMYNKYQSYKCEKAIENGEPTDNHRVDDSGNDLPATGQPPNSSVDKLNPDGSVKQRRYYGPDGRALEDIDYNHSNGDGTHTFPHRHSWDWSQTPPRQ